MKVYKNGDELIIDGEGTLTLTKNKYVIEGEDVENVEFKNHKFLMISKSDVQDNKRIIELVTEFINNGNYTLDNGEMKSIFPG